MNDDGFERLLGSMKRAAGALRDAEVPFALGGGLAVWARGGPRTEHDVDFFVKPEDAQRAQTILTSIGMRAERPPEGWLLKAYDGDILIDLPVVKNAINARELRLLAKTEPTPSGVIFWIELLFAFAT